ncbi:MAG: NADH-quinone oxidoreductase subunit N [Acidobacteria bacterium]|nr:NADH-quinone oxidoreductase subunit N [Acidobacteriota bacterium]
MLVNFTPPSASEYIRVLPEILLTVGGTILMIAEGLAGERHRRGLAPMALAFLLLALGGAVVAGMDPGPAFNNMLTVDGYATFFRLLVLIVGILSVLISGSYLTRENADSADYYALILFSLCGQSILASANELIMVFIGLEISSIATYVLAGFLRNDKRNNEAAIKYFLLGSFATAFLLYGVGWIYGVTGTTNLQEIHRFLTSSESVYSPLLVSACAAMMFVGFAFKVSAAPFQGWAPDVYQGAPAPVSAFMTAAPKAAAFAVFLRVYSIAFSGLTERWQPILWVSAMATMVIGNFAALRQDNIKRMLAYSSVAHAGYVMVAVVAHSEAGVAAAMFYLASYAFMNLGAFAIVTHYVGKGERYVGIDDMAGYARQQPLIAALFTWFLLSLIGVPLTGGFFGKFYVFKSAIDSNLIWLTVLGLLNSAVAAYYYLRIIVVMYFHEPTNETGAAGPVPAGVRLALIGSAIGVFVLGVMPSAVLEFANRSAMLSR